MKVLRIGLFVLGAAILLLVVAATIFVSTFDPNDFKDDLTALVEERTGRVLVINDDIELSLFPWFAVETGGVELGDDPAFGDRNMVSIEELSARVRVWPLLKREVEIGRVVLDGVNLNLGINAEGTMNWSDLLSGPPAAETDAAAEGNAASRPSIRALAVEGIELRNARVRWHDANGDVTWLVRDLNLETGPIQDTNPVDLLLGFSLLDVASQNSAEVTLESILRAGDDIRLEAVQSTIRLLDSREQVRAEASFRTDEILASGDNITAAATTITARLPGSEPESRALDASAGFSSLEFDRTAESLSISDLVTRTDGIDARWNLVGTQMLSSPRFTGATSFSANSIEQVAELLKLDLPATADTVSLGGLQGSSDFTAELSPLAATFSNFSLTAFDLNARGNAELLESGEFQAEIELPAFAPSSRHRELLAVLMSEPPELEQLASISARTSARLSADRTVARLENLVIAVDELQLDGTVTIDNLPEAGNLRGQLIATGLNQRLLGVLLGDGMPAKLAVADVGDFRLETTFNHDPAASMTVLDPMMLSAYGLSGDGRLTLNSSGNTLSISGQASLGNFSPRELLARFELPVPESSDPTVLNSAQIAASFETRGNDGYFRDIAIALDDSRITGEFSVENFADPSYRFVLRADRINADRYLPPRATPETGSTEQNERTVGDIRLTDEALSGTLVTGAASVGDLTLGGMQFQQFATEVSVGRGRAALNSVRTRLYDGEFSGSFVVDTTDESPSVQLTGAASNLRMRPLLVAMLGEANMNGTGSFDLNLKGDGNTIGDAMRTAAGSMEFSLQDGQLDGFNLGHELCSAMNRVNSLPRPASAPETTAFRNISGSAVVSDGIVYSSDLAADTGYATLTGRTNLTLASVWLDTKLVARMAGPVSINGCDELNRHIDPSIPLGFTLQGKLPDVEVGLDIAELLRAIAERRTRQRIEDRVNDRIEDAIRGLFD